MTSESQKIISICIPVFNEAENLPVAVRAVEDLFAPTGPLARYRLEIIVTDNASTDLTWKTATELAGVKSHLKAYRFSRNFGYQNSIFAGLSVATGDAVVELDADLEDPPAVIPRFVEEWENGFDVVYGVRSKRFAPLPLRFLFSLFYKILDRVSDIKIPQNSGDFRLIDRKVLNVLKALPERNLYLRGLVTYLGFKQKAVVFERQPRVAGVSKFRFGHYVVLAIDAITAFSKTPLRLIGVLGVGLFGISTLVAIYYLVERMRIGTPMPGFTTLAILTLIMNSITYIFIGVLGEYLSRIFDDSKFRPRVIIAEAANDPKPPMML